jgi:FkbM family methyltransferase
MEYLLFKFAQTFHEPLTHRVMEDILKKMDKPVMIDAGAWLGDTAIKLTKAVPELVVYAVEPSAKNCKFIRRQAQPNVHVIEKCLTNDSRQKCDTDSLEIFNNKSYTFGTQGKDSITIDEIWSKSPTGVQLVHLDVEGHELGCLTGARRCLEAASTIFIVEILHDNMDRNKIFNLFEKLGYKHFVIPENVGWLFDKGRNYVFIPPTTPVQRARTGFRDSWS